MKSNEMEQALSIRQKLQNAKSCSFDAKVTAAYYEKELTFTLRCNSDKNGNMSFSVLEPDSIADIRGSISESGGNFSFDDTVLAFETLANETVSPIVGPWLLIRSLRSGYISQCSGSDSGFRMDIDDTYRGSNLHLEVFLNEQGQPEGAEVYYDGRRILTVAVSNFEIL